MKVIGFIGAYDKTDMIMYVGKILKVLRKKILIIDSTVTQKAKYIVPSISPTLKYITEFEEIDVAIGFENIEEIKHYLGTPEDKEIEYDYILIDVDNHIGFANFELEKAQKNYFVTSIDVYSLKKGMEILSNLQQHINLTKIYYTKEILKEDDDYLNYLSSTYKVNWNEYKMYFPFENGDLSAIAENQRVEKIKFRKLSVAYKEGLAYLTLDIAKEFSEGNIRKAIKFIEKGA